MLKAEESKAKSRFCDAIEYFLADKATVNFRDNLGHGVIYYLAMAGEDLNTINALLQMGAKIDDRDLAELGQSPYCETLRSLVRLSHKNNPYDSALGALKIEIDTLQQTFKQRVVADSTQIKLLDMLAHELSRYQDNLSPSRQLDLLCTGYSLFNLVRCELTPEAFRQAFDQFLEYRENAIAGLFFDYPNEASIANQICVAAVKIVYPKLTNPYKLLLQAATSAGKNGRALAWYDPINMTTDIPTSLAGYMRTRRNEIHSLYAIMMQAAAHINAGQQTRALIWHGSDAKFSNTKTAKKSQQPHVGEPTPLLSEEIDMLRGRTPQLDKLIALSEQLESQAKQHSAVYLKFEKLRYQLSQASKDHSGSEEDADKLAYDAIAEFITWWESLSLDAQSQIQAIDVLQRPLNLLLFEKDENGVAHHLEEHSSKVITATYCLSTKSQEMATALSDPTVRKQLDAIGETISTSHIELDNSIPFDEKTDGDTIESDLATPSTNNLFYFRDPLIHLHPKLLKNYLLTRLISNHSLDYHYLYCLLKIPPCLLYDIPVVEFLNIEDLSAEQIALYYEHYQTQPHHDNHQRLSYLLLIKLDMALHATNYHYQHPDLIKSATTSLSKPETLTETWYTYFSNNGSMRSLLATCIGMRFTQLLRFLITRKDDSVRHSGNGIYAAQHLFLEPGQEILFLSHAKARFNTKTPWQKAIVRASDENTITLASSPHRPRQKYHPNAIRICLYDDRIFPLLEKSDEKKDAITLNKVNLLELAFFKKNIEQIQILAENGYTLPDYAIRYYHLKKSWNMLTVYFEHTALPLDPLLINEILDTLIIDDEVKHYLQLIQRCPLSLSENKLRFMLAIKSGSHNILPHLFDSDFFNGPERDEIMVETFAHGFAQQIEFLCAHGFRTDDAILLQAAKNGYWACISNYFDQVGINNNLAKKATVEALLLLLIPLAFEHNSTFAAIQLLNHLVTLPNNQITQQFICGILSSAIKNGNSELCHRLKKQFTTQFTKAMQQKHWIILACEHNQPGMIPWLLDEGCQIDLEALLDLLEWAITKNNLETTRRIANLLVTHHDDKREKYLSRVNALVKPALLHKNDTLLKILFTTGANSRENMTYNNANLIQALPGAKLRYLINNHSAIYTKVSPIFKNTTCRIEVQSRDFLENSIHVKTLSDVGTPLALDFIIRLNEEAAFLASYNTNPNAPYNYLYEHNTYIDSHTPLAIALFENEYELAALIALNYKGEIPESDATLLSNSKYATRIRLNCLDRLNLSLDNPLILEEIHSLTPLMTLPAYQTRILIYLFTYRSIEIFQTAFLTIFYRLKDNPKSQNQLIHDLCYTYAKHLKVYHSNRYLLLSSAVISAFLIGICFTFPTVAITAGAFVVINLTGLLINTIRFWYHQSQMRNQLPRPEQIKFDGRYPYGAGLFKDKPSHSSFSHQEDVIGNRAKSYHASLKR